MDISGMSAHTNGLLYVPSPLSDDPITGAANAGTAGTAENAKTDAITKEQSFFNMVRFFNILQLPLIIMSRCYF
jgi:hypothetical protein